MEAAIPYAFALLILGIIFLVMFRKQIIEVFPRLKTIGPTGATLSESQKGALEGTDPRREAESLIRQLDSEFVREVEDNIKAELAKKSLVGQEAVPVLTKYFAVVYIEYLFLNIYRIIFGSQISLLDYLNTQDGQTRESSKIFYELAVSQYSDFYKSYSFDQWLGYLLGQVLLREDNGILMITVRGQEFLLYLTRSRLSRNKAG